MKSSTKDKNYVENFDFMDTFVLNKQYYFLSIVSKEQIDSEMKKHSAANVGTKSENLPKR